MFYTDYPREPVGGSNPYYRCVSCKRTDPEINGKLKGHDLQCEYREELEAIGFKDLNAPKTKRHTKRIAG